MRSPATSVDERAQPARIAVGLELVQRPRLDLAMRSRVTPKR
jgi:hypothetical protein